MQKTASINETVFAFQIILIYLLEFSIRLS